MASILLPLDRCINFPFKKYLKLKFSEFLINENNIKSSLDESRIRIINDILSVWNGYKDEINKDVSRIFVTGSLSLISPLAIFFCIPVSLL
jgi:hypothetical protein